MRRLLILSCSQRKRSEDTELPAIDRYDGQAYRVLHGYLRANDDALLDVQVLSAKYGLIPSDRPIPAYDQKMTRQRAIELRDIVDARLSNSVVATHYESIFVACGAVYLDALGDALDHADAEVRYSAGPIGMQLSQLKRWLYRSDSPAPARGARASRETIPSPVRAAVNDDVLQRARTAIASDPGGASRFSVWYTVIDGQPVSVKWLLHRLTGRPLKSFTSHTAVRELRRMGFQAHES